MVWESKNIRPMVFGFLDFNSSLDGLGVEQEKANNPDANLFQFQFGWFGSNKVYRKEDIIQNFNSSLDGLGDEDDIINKIRALKFQFQFGWFGRTALTGVSSVCAIFQFQFGWFGRSTFLMLKTFSTNFNSSLDGLGE